MKLSFTIFLLVIVTILPYNKCKAQGWNQDRKGIYSVGIGPTMLIAVGNDFSGLTGPGLSANFSGEYKISRIAGVGFGTGINVFFWPYYAYRDQPLLARRVAIGIPLAVKFNVHFLEAANLPISSKLDLYGALILGGGPAFYAGKGQRPFGFIQSGAQIGLRYWPVSNCGIFTEFGWGPTFANVGVSF